MRRPINKIALNLIADFGGGPLMSLPDYGTGGIEKALEDAERKRNKEASDHTLNKTTLFSALQAEILDSTQYVELDASDTSDWYVSIEKPSRDYPGSFEVEWEGKFDDAKDTFKQKIPIKTLAEKHKWDVNPKLYLPLLETFDGKGIKAYICGEFKMPNYEDEESRSSRTLKIECKDREEEFNCKIIKAFIEGGNIMVQFKIADFNKFLASMSDYLDGNFKAGY